MAVHSRQLAGGSCRVAGGRCYSVCGRLPNCLGAASKAGMKCSPQLVVKGGNCDKVVAAAAAAAVLLIFYVPLNQVVKSNVTYLEHFYISRSGFYCLKMRVNF